LRSHCRNNEQHNGSNDKKYTSNYGGLRISHQLSAESNAGKKNYARKQNARSLGANLQPLRDDIKRTY
jgi:hypothetical protein